jgi:sugar phosphate isomerase/epimerase
MFESGLVSVSFRPLEPAAVVELCSANGLGYIEWGSDVHAPCEDTEKLREIVRLQNKHAIICSSYGTYFRIGVDAVEDIYPYIQAAKILGTDILRLWCGDKNYTDMSAQERDFIISESKKLARIAEENGVTLCMECHNKTFTNCLSGAIELMEAVDSPCFRMYWQPNQFRTLEENLEYAEKIAKYTKVIHVFNWEGKEKYPLCQAIEIWKRYLSFFDGSQKLLLEFMPDGKPESLGAEAGALMRIIK